MSFNEWAYDTGQNVPAQLVSTDDREIDALVIGSFSTAVYTDGEVSALNDLDVYPTSRVDESHDVFDTPNPIQITYVASGGGLLYEIRQTYTVGSPTLEQEKVIGAEAAAAKSLLYLDGGFFHDDGAGGGSVLYDSDEVSRFNYTVIGVQANIVGTPFVVSIRDSASVQHSWNSAQWQDFYNSFFTHVIFTRDNFEAAILAIDVAADSAAIQAALDNIPPPNDTL